MKKKKKKIFIWLKYIEKPKYEIITLFYAGFCIG